MANSDVKDKSLLQRMVFAVLTLALIYILIFMKTDDYNKLLVNEIHQIDGMIGHSQTTLIVTRAKGWYQYLVIDSGANTFLNQYIQDTGLKGDSLWRVPLSRILLNFKTVCYQALLRLSLFIYWLWMVAGFVLASVIDGIYARKIKQHGFESPSTGASKLSYWTIALVVVILQLYLIVPAFMLGPLFPLIAAVLIAVLARMFISNSAKVM